MQLSYIVCYKASVFKLDKDKPLVAVDADRGYGVMGALAFDEKTEKIQCHICGQMFRDLRPHLVKHGIDPVKYKDRFGLSPVNPLRSPATRELKIMNDIKRFSLMSSEQREKYMEGRKRYYEARHRSSQKGKGYNESQTKISMEIRNIHDRCPAQMIDKLKRLAVKLGHTPTKTECPFVKVLRVLFGTYNKAVLEAGLKPNPNTPRKWNKGSLITLLKNFVKDHGRVPVASDCRQKLLPGVSIFEDHFGTWGNAKKEADLPVFGVSHGELYVRKEDYVPRSFRNE